LAGLDYDRDNHFPVLITHRLHTAQFIANEGREQASDCSLFAVRPYFRDADCRDGRVSHKMLFHLFKLCFATCLGQAAPPVLAVARRDAGDRQSIDFVHLHPTPFARFEAIQ
jgi:hypothetical protein